MLSDFWTHGAVAQEYGVLRVEEDRSECALFVVDKEGIVRYVEAHDVDEQPQNDDVFAILRQLEPDAPGVADAVEVDAVGIGAPMAAELQSVLLY